MQGIISIPGLTQGRADSLYAPVFNVKAFGAVGDGNAEETAAFAAALAAAGGAAAAHPSTKAVVFAPPGLYRFTMYIDSTKNALMVPPGVTLQGSYHGHITHPRDNPATPPDGTTFLITAGENHGAWPAFLGLNTNSAVRGISFFWPNQHWDLTAPLVYPFAIGPVPGMSGGPGNVSIENIELVNTFAGINLKGAARHIVRNVFGQALAVGIRVEERASDIGRIENVHFNLFWTDFIQDPTTGTVSPPLASFQFQNGTAFLIMGACGEILTNCLAFGYNRGGVADGRRGRVCPVLPVSGAQSRHVPHRRPDRRRQLEPGDPIHQLLHRE